MRAMFCLLALLLFAPPALAQSELVSLSVRATRAADLLYREGSLEHRAASLAVTPRPFMLTNRALLLVSARYRRTAFDLDDGAALSGEPSRRGLNAVDVSVGVNLVMSPRWSLAVGVTPGYRSDSQQALGSEDFQVGGYVIANYLIGGNPRFRLFFGAIAQTHATLIPVLPIAGIAYDNGRLFLQSAVDGVNAGVRLGDRVELGLFGSFGADWYHVRKSGAPAIANAEFLRVTDVGVGPTINVRTVDSLWLNVRGGYAFGRRATYGDADRDKLRDVGFDPESALFLQVGLAWRH